MNIHVIVVNICKTKLEGHLCNMHPLLNGMSHGSYVILHHSSGKLYHEDLPLGTMTWGMRVSLKSR